MRSGFSVLSAAALSLAFAASARAQGSPALQRHLAHLYLGDVLEDIQSIYPPSRPWPSHLEPRGRVTRYRVEARAVSGMPLGIDMMWLGMKDGRLAEIQVIYDANQTQKNPLEALVGELALIYGEPRRSSERFWWSDGKTVLRAFHAEVPVLQDGRKAVELRASLQLLDAGLFRRTD